MEIIHELEPEPRGVYGGAVGYVSYSGNMDLAITIRTLELCHGNVSVQAGRRHRLRLRPGAGVRGNLPQGPRHAEGRGDGGGGLEDQASAAMIVLIDNYDSFTYNLVQAMGGQGADIRVFRNDAITVDGRSRR